MENLQYYVMQPRPKGRGMYPSHTIKRRVSGMTGTLPKPQKNGIS